MNILDLELECDERVASDDDGVLRTHRIADAIAARFGGARADRFYHREDDNAVPLIRHRDGHYSEVLGFAPAFLANVNPSVADFVKEMKVLLGENVSIQCVRLNLDYNFVNEALLWTMARSYIKNRLVAMVLSILNRVTNHQMDERIFATSLPDILDYFVDDFQKNVLNFLSSCDCFDPRAVEIGLLRAVIFSDLLKYGTEIKALVLQNVPDIKASDDVFSEAFLNMLLDWKKQVALELIEHLKMAGHLEFMHLQALREHTRSRLGGSLPN